MRLNHPMARWAGTDVYARIVAIEHMYTVSLKFWFTVRTNNAEEIMWTVYVTGSGPIFDKIGDRSGVWVKDMDFKDTHPFFQAISDALDAMVGYLDRVSLEK